MTNWSTYLYSGIILKVLIQKCKKSVIPYQEFMIKEKDELIICSDGVHNTIFNK